MTAYQAAVIAIRILAILTLVMAAGSLSQALAFGGTMMVDDRVFMLSALLGLTILVVIAGLLWFLAPLLALRIAGTAIHEPEVAARTWTPERVLTIALIIIGVFLIVHSIVPLVVQSYLWIANVHEVREMPRAGQYQIEYMLQPALKLLLGLLLILGAGFWPRLLLRLREFGLEREK